MDRYQEMMNRQEPSITDQQFVNTYDQVQHRDYPQSMAEGMTDKHGASATTGLREELLHAVTLDEFVREMNHASVLRNGDAFEAEDYRREILLDEEGGDRGRRESLQSISDNERPDLLEEVMMHTNRILHNEDGFRREDYVAEKSILHEKDDFDIYS